MPNPHISKLALGTVQFGLDYGISNTEGRTSVEEARQILQRAANAGFRVIDTAAMYGESERVLGEVLPEDHGFKIVTKTERFGSSQGIQTIPIRLRKTLERSLVNLRCDRAYGLLVHNADDLTGDGGRLLFDSLLELKSRGLVEKIGDSVYAGSQIDHVLEQFPVDLVQLPVNVLDQRLIESGHVKRLKERGIEIHSRSAFLQGLLLMDPETIAPYFNPIRDHLRRYFRELRRQGVSPVEAALQFVCNQAEIDTVLVGVCSVKEFEEIRAAVTRSPIDSLDFGRWSLQDSSFLSPPLWKLDDVPIV